MTPAAAARRGPQANEREPPSVNPRAAATAASYALVRVGGGRFAIGLEVLCEVVRPLPLAAVPLGPSALSGFVNLRGSVIPVLDLAAVLGLDAAETGGAQEIDARLLVCDAGSAVALRVGAVTGIGTAPATGIGLTTGTEEGGACEGLLHVGGALYMVLSLTAVLARAFADLGTRRMSKIAALRRPPPPPVTAPPERPFLIFTLAGEALALPAARVGEILPMPPEVMRLPEPGAPQMVRLGESALPLVDPAPALGLGRMAGGPGSGRVIVVQSADRAVPEFALPAEQVREVRPLPGPSTGAPSPPFLGVDARVAAIRTVAGGGRTVTVIDPDRIAATAGLRCLGTARSPSDCEDRSMPPPTDAPEDDQVTIVVFRIGPEEYGISVDAVQEIVRMPDRVTRLPGVPEEIGRVANLRGTVLPLVDTHRCFGVAPEGDRGERQVLVLAPGSAEPAGLIVDGVIEVLTAARAAIRPAPAREYRPAGPVHEVLSLSDGGRMVLLLEPDAVTAALERPEHRRITAG